MSDIKPKEKLIIYDRELDGVFNVKVDYQKLRDAMAELRKCQYTVTIGAVPTIKQTYLEYILDSFFSGVDSEEFRGFSVITHEKNSNNAIDCILRYENSGELGTSDSRVISFANYNRTFSIEELRELYNQIKDCITFVNMGTGEVIDFDGMREIVIHEERVRHVLPNNNEKRRLP